jgi:hypothetical protein
MKDGLFPMVVLAQHAPVLGRSSERWHVKFENAVCALSKRGSSTIALNVDAGFAVIRQLAPRP